MQYVIVYLNTRNDSIGFVADDNGEIAVFDNLDLAVTAAKTAPILRAYPFQIIELDEL